MWSKLLYVGEDEDDIVKASFVEDVDDKDGVVIFEDAEDHTVKVVLVQEAEDGEVYMAKVEDGEDDEDSMVKVVVAEDIEDGATKAASVKVQDVEVGGLVLGQDDTEQVIVLNIMLQSKLF